MSWYRLLAAIAASARRSRKASGGGVAPSFVSPPALIGTPQVGVPMSYTVGVVGGSPAPTVTRQWLLAGAAITGATNLTYTPVSGDAGLALSVRETATNGVGSPANSTSGTANVTSVSAFTAPPVILGTPTAGTPVAYTQGTVTGSPTPTRSRQWLRNGTNISGATSTTYTPVDADIGTAILSVRETATNGVGSPANSTSTAQDVAGVAPSWTVAPAIIGVPTVGLACTLNAGTLVGAPAPTLTYQWTKNGVDISGATSATYTPLSGDVGAALRRVTTASNGLGSPAVSTSAAGTVASAYPTTFDRYISPSGSNANNGLTAGTPWKTFAYAFANLGAGKRLGLLDGTYSVAAGTGCINFNTANSGQVPSGTSKSAMTEVCAVNPGGAVINGSGDYGNAAVWIGRSTRQDSYIKLRGFRTLGAVVLYRSTYCYLKEVGCAGALGIGTNDVSSGVTLANNFNLVEDCWAWSYAERLLVSNYQAHSNIWRRVVIRGDGGGPSGSGNPNVGFTVYNSRDCETQNMLIVDRIVAGSEPYADFATAQHDGTNPDTANFKFGNNVWEGCLSVASQDSSFQWEADDVVHGVTSWTARNCSGQSFNINPGSGDAGTFASCDVSNMTILGSQIRIRDMPVASTIKNSIVANSTTFGMNGNGSLTASYIDTYNNSGGNNITISPGALTFNPLAGSPATIKYPTRVETGSLGKGAGQSGADVGANILFRKGIDGTFRDDAGYNTITAVPLWPWPNEARIKAEMSIPYGSVATTRGFCSTGNQLDGVTQKTLTSYVWESLGNQMPAGVY